MGQFLLCLQDPQKALTPTRKPPPLSSPQYMKICHFLSREMVGAQGKMVNDAGELNQPELLGLC